MIFSSFPVWLFWEVSVTVPILWPGNKSLGLAQGHTVRNQQSQIIQVSTPHCLTPNLAHTLIAFFLNLVGHPFLPQHHHSALVFTYLDHFRSHNFLSSFFSKVMPPRLKNTLWLICLQCPMIPRYLQGNAYNLSISVAHTRPPQLLSLQSPLSHGLPCLPSLHLLFWQLPLLKNSFLFSRPTTGGRASRLSLVGVPQDLYVCLC